MKFRILKPRDKEAIMAYIGRLPDDKRYDVDISLKREKRTINQNSLYWLWLTCISHETGNEKEDLHDHFGSRYLPRETHTVIIGGKQYVTEKPVSTTTLDTSQFTQYLNKVQVFANSELGIHLPNPEDLIWESFYETYKNMI